MKKLLKTIVHTSLHIGKGYGWCFLLMAAGLPLHAQEFSIEYTTELQTNLHKSNFVNLLRLIAEYPISKSLTVEASTISLAKTRDERLVDDLQTFSNIEEENLPLAIAVCGTTWQINDNHSLFAGIRNMNEDYFASPITSFFTNSSCGIFPTISVNYPIANYPVASMGVHYHYDGNPVRVQASLYNGTGFNRFTGRENVFRICPKDDGVFGVAEAAYSKGGGYYTLGTALRWKDGMSATPWVYAEQRFINNVSMLAGYSHTFTSEAECKDFVGIGLHYQRAKCELGVFADYANFANARELAAEVTLKYNATTNLYIQPVLHIISDSFIISDSSEECGYKSTLHPIATLRIGATL